MQRSRAPMITARISAAISLAASVAILPAAPVAAQQPAPMGMFSARDVYDLEWAQDPQISPDGRRIVFGRTGYDILKDFKRSSLWIINADGSDARALLAPGRTAGSPRWSPDGTRLLYVSSVGGKASSSCGGWTPGRRRVSRHSPMSRARSPEIGRAHV